MRDEYQPSRGNRQCGGHLIILEAPVALLLRTESGVGSADDFHADAWFVPQEGLFASLTLRASRKYVRYSATLRSYSGFVDVTDRFLRQSLNS